MVSEFLVFSSFLKISFTRLGYQTGRLRPFETGGDQAISFRMLTGLQRYNVPGGACKWLEKAYKGPARTYSGPLRPVNCKRPQEGLQVTLRPCKGHLVFE